jgi:hypothetical protein
MLPAIGWIVFPIWYITTSCDPFPLAGSWLEGTMETDRVVPVQCYIEIGLSSSQATEISV